MVAAVVAVHHPDVVPHLLVIPLVAVGAVVVECGRGGDNYGRFRGDDRRDGGRYRDDPRGLPINNAGRRTPPRDDLPPRGRTPTPPPA